MKTYYIGNQPKPEDRTQIHVSNEDADRVKAAQVAAGRGGHYQVTVTDLITNSPVTVADEDCGLDCRCAMRFVHLARASFWGRITASDHAAPNAARNSGPQSFNP